MWKKLTAFFLSLVLLTSTASAGLWPDWAASAEDWAEQNGLSDTFLNHPGMTVTRGQAAQMLYEAAGSPAVSDDIPFTDIPESFADAVTWAAQNGYVQGIGDEKYAPNRQVTRQEFAVMLYRAAGSPAPYAYTLKGFADLDCIADWAWDAMRWCVGTGLIAGTSSDTLSPEDTITVAQAALILQRRDNGGMDDETIVVISSLDEIKTQLRQAMQLAVQPPLFQIEALADRDNLEIDIRNLYYALLSDEPQLKYAYDLQVRYDDGGLLCCTFSYMPYQTGSFPADFSGTEVSTLQELMDVARQHLSSMDDAAIRIVNRDLTVDDMNKALQQVGYGYVLCQLNRDGTAITFSALNGMSEADCLSYIERTDTLADMVVGTATNEGMSLSEKAEALYTWLTETVRYDQRYYSDPVNLPYASRAAYGALHDHLAICGGYAQALQILFEKVGIPCYTVSGSMGGEYHMWNVAYLDGAWRYFDATSDRGRADYWFNYFGVSAEQLTRYTWDSAFVARLTEGNAIEM